MFNLALVGGLVGLLLTPSAMSATPSSTLSTVVPAVPMTVEVATVNGSGCPSGTATVSPLSGNSGFTVAYSAFTAVAGGTADAVEFRKNCQMSLRIATPPGFSFAVERIDYRGTASLAAGATGTELTGYYFQGSSDTLRLSHTFAGPYSGSWQATEATGLVFSPCEAQRNLNINTELRVDPGTSDPHATSVMALGGTRSSLRTVYSLTWRTCP